MRQEPTQTDFFTLFSILLEQLETFVNASNRRMFTNLGMNTSYFPTRALDLRSDLLDHIRFCI